MEGKKEIAVIYEVEGEEIKLTKQIVESYLTNGAQITMPEFKMFTSLCKARGLNPFLKEAYIVKFGNKPAQIIVGKDAILKRAILHKQFNGREQGVIVLTETNEIIERKGTFILASDTIVGGWAKVYRKDWEHPTYITVSFNEVAGKKADGSLNHNWLTKSATMVEKVALMRALRESFIEQVGGMYDADEMDVVQQTEDVEVIESQDDNLEEEPTETSNTVDLDKL